MALMDKEAGRKCLLEVSDLLKTLGLQFFLMQGTALGAYRDGGFVPTERDIDFGILQENLTPVAIPLVSRLAALDFQVETFSLPFHKVRTIVAWKYGAKVDLVGMIRWGNLRFTANPVHPSVVEPYALVHEAEILENYAQITLFEQTFNMPYKIETYLEREYGDDWRTPKDDHVSRTRIYDFISKEGIPEDHLDA